MKPVIRDALMGAAIAPVVVVITLLTIAGTIITAGCLIGLLAGDAMRVSMWVPLCTCAGWMLIGAVIGVHELKKDRS